MFYEDLQKLLSVSLDQEEFSQFLAAKKIVLFDQINQIVFYGKGGYSFDLLYEMPIWLRHFIYRKLVEYYQQEQESIEEAKKGRSPRAPKSKVRVPDLVMKRSSK